MSQDLKLRTISCIYMMDSDPDSITFSKVAINFVQLVLRDQEELGNFPGCFEKYSA